MKQINISVQASLQNTDDLRVPRELLFKIRYFFSEVCINVNVRVMVLSVLEKDKIRVFGVKNGFLSVYGFIPPSSLKD